MRPLFGLAAIAAASSAGAAQQATPLFASDAPIRVTIQGPIASLASNRAEVPRPATMTVDGVAYPITLSPRGITRKTSDICDFPPLRVQLTGTAPPGSLFERQRRLKLVTHCKRAADFQQKVLLEYAAYRLYNLITPLSFRARLANIDYVDANGRPFVSRVGFFIEDFDDVAKRNDMRDAHMGSLVPLAQIDPQAGGRMAVFEYMISNYDWSMRAAPKGEECCHNGRLLAGGTNGLLTPVPYDFDYAGLVDAPYATPPEGIPVSNVRQRNYRGYCVHLAQARTVAAQISPRRSEFIGLFATIPGLDQRSQARAASYIQAFFNDVDSGKIFKTCVN
ncbi:MAG TPA: hypothetical protein VJT70_09440 [Sphingomicrobium sp.]|nr:hypothetical protein [Sphingomicrobium sp.]